MFNCPKSSVEALPPLLLVQDAQLVFISSFHLDVANVGVE